MSDHHQTPDGQRMLTDDGRCGFCGAKVETASSEPGMQVPRSGGWLDTIATDFTLRPCGHTWREVAR